MKKFALCVMCLFFSISLTNVFAAARKREDFRYETKSGDFKMNDDWFSSKKTTRRQMEQEREEKQRNAIKEERERQRTILENAEREQKEKRRTPPPKIESTDLKSETEGLRSGVKSRVSVNAEIQQTRKSLYERTGNYPTVPKIPTPVKEK